MAAADITRATQVKVKDTISRAGLSQVVEALKVVEAVMEEGEVEVVAALAVAQGDSVVAAMAGDRSLAKGEVMVSVEVAVEVSEAATSVEDAEDLRVVEEEADTVEVVGEGVVGKASEFGSLYG
jgi:hypothetical protein